MKNFRTFDLAVSFYREAKTLSLPPHLRDQLDRAASSIALNLCEGRGKRTRKDQLKYFYNAMGSARECHGILILADVPTNSPLLRTHDAVCASLHCLIRNAR